MTGHISEIDSRQSSNLINELEPDHWGSFLEPGEIVYRLRLGRRSYLCQNVRLHVSSDKRPVEGYSIVLTHIFTGKLASDEFVSKMFDLSLQYGISAIVPEFRGWDGPNNGDSDWEVYAYDVYIRPLEGNDTPNITPDVIEALNEVVAS